MSKPLAGSLASLPGKWGREAYASDQGAAYGNGLRTCARELRGALREPGEPQLIGDILGDWPKILTEVTQQRDDLRTELERIARVGAKSKSATARLLASLAARALTDG